MAQYFLLSAAARTLSLKEIFREGEEAAYRRFRRLRWPETDGSPVCPICGCLDAFELGARRWFKCAACHRQFSVTSGTIFASRKLGFVDLLAAICLVANAAKGMSALQLARDLRVQPKTAFVLIHKLREAMAAETRDTTLDGEIEVDGAAFGGHVRPANLREERADRRLLANRSGKRRIVVALRQRGGRTLARRSCARLTALISRRRGSRWARSYQPTRARTGTCWSRTSTCSASPMPTPTAGMLSIQTIQTATFPVSGA